MPNPDLTLEEGAIAPWAGARGEYFHRVLAAVAQTYKFRMTTAWKDLKKADQKVLLYGSGTKQVHVQYRNRYGRTRSYHTHYEGVMPYLQRRHYKPAQRPFRACHSRDLLDQVTALCRYRGMSPVITRELLDRACAAYFVDDEEV